ncbi:23S rRNA (guanosine(2251)-2'-O)-methyltransferase RlmB [Acetobacteraceae bacterium H6797]|nr:23S rRNA (guanosine(2251)-2'-O)-methyltransferase RlmB [Acetobacteraceae bacterium H6797]
MRPPRRPPQADSPSKSFSADRPQGRAPQGRPQHGQGKPRPPREADSEERPRFDRGAGPKGPRGPRRPVEAEAAEAPARPRPEREFFQRRRLHVLPETAPGPRKPDSAPSIPVPPGSYWLHGVHAVAAALKNPQRRARRLLLTEEAEANLAAELPRPWRLNGERVERSRFQTFLPEDAVHQGAALLVDPLQPVGLEDAIEAHPGPVLLLDQVTDPRNVGAILRSAAAFGAAAVVVQDRNAPPETAAMARTASGALEIVPMVREVNISRAITTLQKAGFWVMGLDGSAKTTLAAAIPRDRRVALVLGAEDTGLRRLQRESVDELVKLPIASRMESLNVSAAAAAALYEVIREQELD